MKVEEFPAQFADGLRAGGITGIYIKNVDVLGISPDLSVTVRRLMKATVKEHLEQGTLLKIADDGTEGLIFKVVANRDGKDHECWVTKR